MIVSSLDSIVDTDRDVRAATFHSRRLLLAQDNMGFSLHDTVLFAGTETHMWYKNHLEAVYCIEGTGELRDLATGIVHPIEPGVMYALVDHDKHILKATTDLRMICVFNPPLVGKEVHDEEGVYPLLTR